MEVHKEHGKRAMKRQDVYGEILASVTTELKDRRENHDSSAPKQFL